MVDPGTATLIATAIATAAQAGSQGMSAARAKKAGKLRSKELESETNANLLNDALQRNAELQTHRLNSRGKLAKRSVNNMQETADLLRGAFNI